MATPNGVATAPLLARQESRRFCSGSLPTDRYPFLPFSSSSFDVIDVYTQQHVYVDYLDGLVSLRERQRKRQINPVTIYSNAPIQYITFNNTLNTQFSFRRLKISNLNSIVLYIYEEGLDIIISSKCSFLTYLRYSLLLFIFLLGFSTATHERVCVAGTASACESTRSSESITFEGLVLSLSLSLSLQRFFFYYYYYFYLFFFIYISSIHLFFPSISCYFLLLDSLILLCVRSSSIFLDCDQINSL